MIPQTKRPTVLTNELGGDSAAFSIQISGTAFRVLADSIYSDKIGTPVREVISNGYDSHAAAGTPEIPLLVTAPTSLDPMFRVRDYGTSMSHETIMEIYSTLFASTKTQTNDQVGMFGLGSKSPFAYTNSFSVVCYMGGEKRIYVAHIDDTEIPQITHLDTVPTDEVNGVEVSFAVESHDVSTFQQSITDMYHASDVAFRLDGMTVTAEDVLFRGDGFKVTSKTYGDSPLYIRQGCVRYPVDHHHVSSVNQYNAHVTIDVPIGSVEVTASRESLSMTEATKITIGEAVDRVDHAIRAHIDQLNGQFPNRLAELHGNTRFEWCTVPIGRSAVTLVPDKRRNDVPGQSIERMYSQRRVSNIGSLHLSEIRRGKFVVIRPGEKVVRSRLRLAEFFKNRSGGQVYIVRSPELSRVVRLLGLTADQIIPISELPDVKVERTNVGTGSTASGVKAPKKTLRADQFWMLKTGSKRIETRFLQGYYAEHSTDMWNQRNRAHSRSYYADHTDNVPALMALLGFKADDVVYLTEKQAEALGAGPDQDFMVEFDKRLTKYADDNDIAGVLALDEAMELIRSEVNHWGFVNAGVDRQVARCMEPIVTEALVEDLDDLPADADMRLIKTIAAKLEIDPAKKLLTIAQIETKVKEVTDVFANVSIDDLVSNYQKNHGGS